MASIIQCIMSKLPSHGPGRTSPGAPVDIQCRGFVSNRANAVPIIIINRDILERKVSVDGMPD